MKKYIIVVLFFISISGCNEYLKEDIRTFLTPEILMQSKDGIESAVMGAYRHGGGLYTTRNIYVAYEVNTDEALIPAPSGERHDMCAYTFNSYNMYVDVAYGEYARGINHANMVLDNLPKVGTLGIAGEKRFLEIKRGEALFLRARHYFYHMNTFGTVPLITSFNDAEQFPSNSTIPELYAQIIADLSEAETLLPGWKDSENEPGRATRGAAKSLLGRVYLYKASSKASASDDYQKAASKFKEIIDNEGYDLWDNYKDAFIPENENGKEDIHSYQTQTQTNGSSIYIENVPSPNPAGSGDGYQQIVCSRLLFDSFEAGDKRKEDGWWEDGSNGLMFTGDYTVRTTGEVGHAKYICTEKYIDPSNSPVYSTNSSTNFPLIRYADVLLMYAEALNEINNGPSDHAYWAINKVRARAGLDPLSGLSKDAFFDALVEERFHELWLEGIRWFDLIRWGILKERILMREHITGYPKPIPVETPKHLVFPFPLSELQVNPNLTQNPGY